MRSRFMRDLLLNQLGLPPAPEGPVARPASSIPRRLIRYWHDDKDIPEDVSDCLASWDRLAAEGFELQMFNDDSAQTYIAERHGAREAEAFLRCRHPAMRCDYFRMCALIVEGGLYVDADDVLLGDEWTCLFRNDALKLQPLCYDIGACSMVAAAEFWRADAHVDGRIFYVNNDPIAAPPGHPILLRALATATEKLLGSDRRPEIQSTTGPGNLTAALAAHAQELSNANLPFDFELLRNWDKIAETRWELSYRGDARNWRNMDQGGVALSDGATE